MAGIQYKDSFGLCPSRRSCQRESFPIFASKKSNRSKFKHQISLLKLIFFKQGPKLLTSRRFWPKIKVARNFRWQHPVELLLGFCFSYSHYFQSCVSFLLCSIRLSIFGFSFYLYDVTSWGSRSIIPSISIHLIFIILFLKKWNLEI